MSIQAVAWVLEHSEATLADRLVLIAIANHADARGWNAWPKIEQIALEARVGRRTVYRSIEILEALGELTVERRTSKPSIYGIPALMGCQDDTPKGWQSGTQGVPSSARRGARLPPEPSLTVHEPRAAPEFVTRCPQCDLLKFDCQCEKPIQRDKAKGHLRAIRQKEEPA